MRKWLCIFALLWLVDTVYMAFKLFLHCKKTESGEHWDSEMNEMYYNVASVIWFILFIGTITMGVWCSLQK